MMDCNAAEKLMMSYMDGEMTEKEAESLQHHICQCSNCKEDFFLYDSLVADMEFIPVFEAPSGFEDQVMASIAELPLWEEKTLVEKERGFWKRLVAIFTGIFGVGLVILWNSEWILNSLAQNPTFYAKMQALAPIEGHILEQKQMLLILLQDIFSYADQTLTNAIDIIVILIMAVIGVQGYLLWKNWDRNGMNGK